MSLARASLRSAGRALLPAALLCTAVPAAPLGAQEVEPVNHLPNPYETVMGWGKLPPGREWGSVPAVQIDPDGRSLWVLDRCGTKSWQSVGPSSCAGQDLPPVMKLDTRTGELLLAFGAGLFVFPHALHVDPAGNVWVADSRAATEEELARYPSAAGKGHVVVKLSPEGEVLLTLGTPGEAGDPPQRLNQPLDVAVSPNGDVFVAEGDHSGTSVARISKFSADGTFLASWGRPGSGPGELRIPHGLAFDARGRLFVADRGNHRIQIFDQQGNHLDEYRKFGRPSDVFIDREGLLYAIDSESGQRLNPGWRKGIRIGRASDGEVLYFIPPHFIEDTFLFPSGITVYSEGAAGDGVTVDADGNVYAAEVGTGNPIVGITQYIRRFDLTK
ncbi:MAG TPA: peptidyl-alpha-hydroxyglycine alpha-amidating lyase family protein [Longimicrobiales bacterium]|nr:peptidyl-alpha-hydroxyglycine alpha-amidating lyase family protein [Longimicrobiales bacterium]